MKMNLKSMKFTKTQGQQDKNEVSIRQCDTQKEQKIAMLPFANSSTVAGMTGDDVMNRSSIKAKARVTSQSRFIHKLAIASLCLVLFLTGMPLPEAQAASSSSAMSSIDTLYDSITALERVLELQNVQIRALRQQNNASLKGVQERIRQLDTSRLATMQTALKQLENRHAPLLKRYADLGKRIAEARKKKDDRNVQSLLLERNGIKAQVEAARAELKNKRTELATARKASTVRKQQLRSLLQPVQTLKKQITSENKAITAAWKIRTSARKGYHASVRQGNAVTALAHLTVVYKQLGQVQASRQKILNWEQQITKTIQTVASRPDLTNG
ncbi:hypothetical protein L2089_14395 [Paenibacillus hunanensis]|uniref:hypothetical protein n=1 Tax=Paenibacillus hunanensis TaxID=539262 RepID=UPI002026D4AB|nr:hypothetical protein [Paenibacillus hunanensis]MCL9661888.1 hypothetical protein [Paenibacillus hunanensis]